ncbi:MAG: diguanylate cyclase [Azonexus sp.]|jgi:diguanylate cyclase (GGDEF)-like protein|uniref:GGDEF domain-containing protein n=1 Tax=Azonexus sp. TaxID=1872668 RepID=UPI00282B91F7|nr:diguanylate cyclase [Azonexus sp.]MDR0776663.1 diguanylate cyclase [Azonexus sp.]
MPPPFLSVTALAEALESHWQQYRATGDFTLFVEFTVSLNGLIEHLTRRHMAGLARIARELENTALTLFGDAAQQPLLPDLANAIESKLLRLLDELLRHEEPPPPNRRYSDSPGDEAADPWTHGRNVLIVAAAEHPWLESLSDQLASFGFLPSVTSWSGLVTDEPAPLAILCLPELPGAYPAEAVTVISELRKHFPSSHIYCLAVPAELESIVRLQRAGADTCIPAASGRADILARLLDLAREDEPEADRVLVVEDSQTATVLVRRALTQHGIDSLAVADPRRLLEVAAGYHPDAILMDMYMPFCSGVEATAALRQFTEYQALPVIYLSSETDIAQQIEALRLGGDQFLTKPVNPVVLAAVVKTKIARYREMRHSGQHDGLTRLLNHTTAKTRIGQRVAEALPDGRLVVAMLDIDRFKSINDTWGHPVGDQVIRNLAWLLRGRLRSSDLIGRYGGEEFIVALPDTDLADAVAQFDRIREGFAVLPHAHGTGTIHATFSCGVAALADHQSAAELIGAADAALLQAKRSGRNRVVASVAGMQMEEAAGGEL